MVYNTPPHNTFCRRFFHTSRVFFSTRCNSFNGYNTRIHLQNDDVKHAVTFLWWRNNGIVFFDVIHTTGEYSKIHEIDEREYRKLKKKTIRSLTLF